MSRLSTTLAVPLVLLVQSLASHAAGPPSLSLEALNRGVVRWTLELQHGAASLPTCRLLVAGRAETLQPSEAECKSLNRLATAAAAKISHSPSGSRTVSQKRAVFDEPSYRLVSGDKAISVALRSPRECELLRKGELKCRDITLSAEELLLNKLLGYAAKMGLLIKK